MNSGKSSETFRYERRSWKEEKKKDEIKDRRVKECMHT